MERRRIPRGPAEWGRLLFEPEWVATDRFTGEKAGYHLVLALMLTGAFAISVLTILFPFHHGPPLFIILTLGTLMMAAGAAVYIFNHKQMPFRVYEAGFTLTEVDRRKGLRMEEELVPWDRLRSVELEEREYLGQIHRNLVLHYDDGSGGEATLRMFPFEVRDPLGMIIAIRDIAPDRLGEGFDLYVGPGSENRVLSVPKGLSHPFRKRADYLVSFSIGMCIFFGIMMGAVIGHGFFSIPRGIILAGMPIAVFTIIIIMLAFGGEGLFLTVANIGAQVRGDSIIYPRPKAFRLLLAIRPSLPVGSVRKVVKCLDPITFGHEASIATSMDGSLRVPYSVFEALEGRSDFRREGRVLINRRPAPESDIAIARTSWPRVLLLWLALLGIMFGTSLVNTMTNEGLFGIGTFVDEIAFWLVVLIFGIVIPSIFLSSWRYSRQQKLGEGLEILPDVLRVPKAPKGMRKIPREDVVKIWTYARLMAKGILLETRSGTLDLALGLGSKLRKAGYEVIDEPDLIQRELSAGEGMGEFDGP